MTKRLQVYEAEGLIVTFDPNVCVHSAVCISALPAVFDVKEKRWIRPELGPANDVMAVVAKCPSGALQVVRAGQAPQKTAPVTAAGAVEVRVKPNGPLLVRGQVQVIKENGEVVDKVSCALCRCGGTGTAPFCDGSHNRIGFRSPS